MAEQPKKPQTAYFLYLNDNRAGIVKQLGAKGSKTALVARTAAEQWNKLADKAKAPYQKRAAQANAEYYKALEKFKGAGGVIERKRKADKGQQPKKDKNAPKKPCGGCYRLYLSQHRAEIAKSLPAGSNAPRDVAKAAGAKWMALSYAQKQPYKEMFRKKHSEYLVELKKYEKNTSKAAATQEKAARADRRADEASQPRATPTVAEEEAAEADRRADEAAQPKATIDLAPKGAEAEEAAPGKAAAAGLARKRAAEDLCRAKEAVRALRRSVEEATQSKAAEGLARKRAEEDLHGGKEAAARAGEEATEQAALRMAAEEAAARAAKEAEEQAALRMAAEMAAEEAGARAEKEAAEQAALRMAAEVVEESKKQVERLHEAQSAKASASSDLNQAVDKLQEQVERLQEAQSAKASDLHQEVDELKKRVERLQDAQSAKVDELKKEAEMAQEAQSAKVKSVQAQPSLAWCYALPIEKSDVLTMEGKPLRKLTIRVVCPGVRADQIGIEPLPNGVVVHIAGNAVCGDYSEQFLISESEGRFKLCTQELTLDRGILMLTLQQSTPARLRFHQIPGRPFLLPISELADQDCWEPTQASLHSTISSREESDRADDDEAASVESWTMVGSPASHEVLSDSVLSSRCFMHDAQLLGENGVGIAVADLKVGHRLSSIHVDGDALNAGGTSVRALRFSTLRDYEVADISMSYGSDGYISMRVTTSHKILTSNPSWVAQRAGDVRENRDQLILLKQGDSPYIFSPVKKNCTSIHTGQAVEIEFEDPSHAVLLQVSDGLFAAVFVASRMDAEEIATRNETLDASVASVGLTASSHLDPTDAKANSPSKKRKLCDLCHSFEQKENTKRGPRHGRVNGEG